MKKRWLPLIMLFCFSTGFVGGCSKDNTSPVSELNINGSDIVLKVGDKTYSADQLFADMVDTGAGVSTIYESILRMVVESTVEIDANMTASWELMLDSFEEEVSTTAASSGISEKEAREQLLAEEGYSSIDEKRDDYYYNVKLSKLQDEYWNEKKDEYFDSYFEERLPYYVKHVLVKTTYTSARGPYSSLITSSNATALYKVYDMLAKDYKFSYIINQLSEDPGSSSTGLGYHMDLTTSFVTEFLHGVFVFDALLKGETSEVMGITESANLYKSTDEDGEGYNFGVINASDIVALGDNASNSSYKNISTYDKEDDTNAVSSISSAYSSTEALYSMVIIFNQTFNNPGISVIAYDLDEETKPKNLKTININGVEKDVLTDENGNIVFAVYAKDSGGIHFLTVNVSPFDENAKLFFSIDQEATINKMVAAKETALKQTDKTDAQIAAEVDAYRETLENYKTYVDIKGGEKQTNRNVVIDELETIVKEYAKRGISGGKVAGQDQFLTYDMVEYYMDKGNITINDEIVVAGNKTLKDLVEQYIANQKELIDSSVDSTIVDGWAEYYDRVSLANSDEIVSKKIPMECSYAANGNNDTLCKYSYEKGFQILMKYTANSGTMPDEYVQSYYIGDDSFDLPVPTRSGYIFDGWYSTSDFKEGTKVESIDTSKSSTNNKTQLYAKWTSETPEGGE